MCGSGGEGGSGGTGVGQDSFLDASTSAPSGFDEGTPTSGPGSPGYDARDTHLDGLGTPAPGGFGASLGGLFGGLFSRSAPTPERAIPNTPVAKPTNIAAINAGRDARAAFIENTLNARGFTQSGRQAGYLNVDPVTGARSTPMSPAAQEAAAAAALAFDRSEAGRALATEEAKAAFATQTSGAKAIDPGLIAAATGRVPGLTPEQVAKAQTDLGKALAAGQMAPNAAFNDRFGSLLGPTLAETQSLLGTGLKADSYFSNLSKGFNRSGGLFGLIGENVVADSRGNIGFNNFGDRLGQFAIGTGLPAVAGMANPMFGAALSGLQMTTMTPYGSLLGSTSTLSYNPSRAVQGIAFSGLSNAAGSAIARGMYDGTNLDTAMLAGTVGGIALGSAGASLAGKAAEGVLGGPITIGTSEPGGIGAGAMRGSDIAESVGPAMSGEGARPEVGISARMGDERSGFGDTLLAQQPTSFIGGEPPSQEQMSLNPMFAMSPAGVQYFSRGRQRDTGNTTYGAVSPLIASLSQRRGNITNAMRNVI